MSLLRRGCALAALVVLAISGCAAPPAVRQHPRPPDTGDQDAVDDALSIDQGWHSEDAWTVSPPLGAAAAATHVSALLVTAGTDPLFALETRGLWDGEPVGDWVALGETFVEDNQHVVEADVAGPIDSIQVRFPTVDVQRLVQAHWSVSAIVPDAEIDGDDTGGALVAGATAELRTELSGFGIVTREAWGARRTSCGPTDAPKYRITIHHTETGSSNPAAQLRSIQAYHISKGWCDIGYHFLVGADGRLYEGRPLEIRGVHTLSNNTGNVGIAFVGSFDGSPPSDAMLDIVARLMGTLSRLYGIELSST